MGDIVLYYSIVLVTLSSVITIQGWKTLTSLPHVEGRIILFGTSFLEWICLLRRRMCVDAEFIQHYRGLTMGQHGSAEAIKLNFCSVNIWSLVPQNLKLEVKLARV